MAETTEEYRNRINQLKTSIENEPYIKKMREDIAEGISKTGNRQADIEVRQDILEDDFIAVQQDASSASPSGAEVAVARAGFNTLDERLTTKEQQVNAQLVQTNQKKADITYVDTLVSQTTNGAIKGAFPTLNLLEAAYPNGIDTGPFLVNENSERYIWDINKKQWISIGVYEPPEIEDNSISLRKTTFFKNYYDNLMNKYTILNDTFLTSSGQTATVVGGKTTDFIEIEVGETYAISPKFNNTGAWSSHIYNSNKISIGTIPENAGIVTINDSQAKYVRLVSTADFPANVDIDFMMVRGTVYPGTYIPHVPKVMSTLPELTDFIKTPELNSVGPEHTTFFNLEHTNLIDRSKIMTDRYLKEDGFLGEIATGSVSDFIPVEYGKSYKLPPFIAELASGWSGHLYDVNKVSLGIFEAENRELTISNPLVRYVRIVWQRPTEDYILKDMDVMMVEGTIYPNEYVPYLKNEIGFRSEDAKSLFAKKLKPYINPLSTDDKTALCFGDSITKTQDISEDGHTINTVKTNWPTYAKKGLNLSTIINFAEDGASYTNREQSSFYQKLSNQINVATQTVSSPDIVVVSAGTNDDNDNLGDYETAMSKVLMGDLDLTLFYEAVRWAMWKLRISYPLATFYVGLPIQSSIKSLKELDGRLQAIKKMAEVYNFIIIDAWAQSGIVREVELATGGLFLDDGLHPNEIGKEKLGKCYARVIKNTHT